jgi:hypothetical protein
VVGAEAFITWLGANFGSKKKIREKEKQINDLLGELAILISKIDDVEKAQARTLSELDREKLKFTELESHCHDLEAQLDTALIAQKLAEGRVEELRASLDVERIRFDRAIEHERDVDRGIRTKIGLIPSSSGDKEQGTPRPVSSGRVPWRNKQAELQQASKEQADKLEAHYRNKIEEVEAKDNELADDLRDLEDDSRSQ